MPESGRDPKLLLHSICRRAIMPACPLNALGTAMSLENGQVKTSELSMQHGTCASLTDALARRDQPPASRPGLVTLALR